MAFFRKWKLHYKHKKLSEEWALATSMKDLSETNLTDELDCNFGKSNKDKSNNDGDDDDGDDGKSIGITTFDLKYLGSTSIDSEKSQKSTADAIKSVISLSKAARRKNQRVKLMVSPQGIDVINPNSGETLLRVSIYKISYCSADAAHDHVFAFVGSEDDSIKEINDEKLSCHVFYCAKRKIAHDVTLTVAKCFENAYEVWRETVNRKMMKDEMFNNRRHQSTNNSIKVAKITSTSTITTNNNNHNNNNNVEQIEIDDGDGADRRNNESQSPALDLLIDFAQSEIRSDLFEKDNREYLQNTWVSFDDDNSQRNDLGRLIVC